MLRILLLLATSIVLLRAERLESIVVNLGKHVIMESEVLDYVRLSSFLDETAPDFSPEARRKAATHLVDRFLILQDAALTNATLASEADLETVLGPLKARFQSEERYQAALRAVGISELVLRAHILAGLRLLRYTDSRFKPEVQITEETLRATYQSFLLRQPKQQSIAPPTFEESREQLEQLLSNQLAAQAMDRWLDMARGETNIVYREAAFR